MQFLKITTFVLFISAFLVFVQVLLFYAKLQHDYIFNCKDKRGAGKTTDKTHEDVKLMSYGRNTYTTIRQENIKVMSYDRKAYTTIRQEDIKASQNHMIFPKINLYDVEPDWRKKAVVLKGPVKNTKRHMTIGIVTAKRPNYVTYLYNTLNSILQSAAKEEKTNIYIIILLADFDDDWRRNVTNKIKDKYYDDIQEGTIQVLQGFSWMYPKLDNLSHHYRGHPESLVRWKAKQNIDFAFLWLYVYKGNMTQFYLHLEDDVTTVTGYIQYIKDFIKKQEDRWVCLEFSELGMIAKLYHTYDLESLAKIVTLFYEEQPADDTYLKFNHLMLQFGRIIRKPTLFQHNGVKSSLPGKIQLLQDRYSIKDLHQKTLMGDNPPAQFETNIATNSAYPPESAYEAGFGHCWSDSPPKKGDYFRIKFESPQMISRIIIVSGLEKFPKDMFYHAVVETSSKLNCTNYELKGKFINGTADISNVTNKANKTSTYCIQIRVMENNPFWVLIQEIGVFLLR